MKPLLSAFDLNLLMAGKHHHAWKILGAHPLVLEGVEGCRFAVWAPGVQRVSVVGDFNQWDGREHPMRCCGDSGV